MKRFKPLVSLLLAFVVAVTVMGLGGLSAYAEEHPRDPDDGVYISTPAANPLSWNPFTWVNVSDMVMLEYVVTPLVGNYLNEDNERIFEFEAATNITDITSDFKDKAKWGIDEDSKEGFVWKIELNPEKRLCDGTPITADDYIWSMQQLLEPDTAFSRASRYSVGAESIRGAFLYRNNDRVGTTRFMFANTLATVEEIEISDGGIVHLKDGREVVINPDMPLSLFGNDSMQVRFEGTFMANFFNDNGDNLVEKYRGENGYVPVTEEIVAELIQLAASFPRVYDETRWLELAHVIDGDWEITDWDDVGLQKVDDYTILYITNVPMTETAFFTLMRRSWLVQDGPYQRPDYNTSENTASFGPYRMVEITDTEILLEKNEHWYGWNGTHRPGLYSNEEFGDWDYVHVMLHPVDEEDEDEPEIIFAGGEPAPFRAFPFAFNTVDTFGNPITEEDLGEKELWFIYLYATW